jgi:erythromycin esterase
MPNRAVVLVALGLATGTPFHQADPTPAQLDWLRSNAIEIKSVEAGTGFADLQGLKAVIGEARIVSLGESTHGTREIFQMKHRLTEFLASELGFTIFSIEANMPESYLVNDYVLHGKGDPKALLKGMYFWTWNTEEVLAMIEWMRQFNASGKGRIQFTGFDMQTSRVAIDIVQDLLQRVDPDYEKQVRTIYQEVATVRGGSSSGVARPEDVSRRSAGVVAYMEKRRADYLKQADGAAVEWAIQNARVVHQYTQMVAKEVSRDESMARNVKWIVDTAPKGTRLVLWAHNFHVSRASMGPSGAMGRYLDDWYGKDHLVVGFAVNRGEYTAIGRGTGLGRHPLKAAEPGSYEYVFAKSGLPRFILDLRRARSGASGWLRGPMQFRSIGAMAMDQQFHSTELSKLYDLMVFLDETTATHGLWEAPRKK